MSTVTVDRVALIAKLLKKNDEARALSRRGFAGYMSQRYAELHAEMNDIVTVLEGIR